MAGSRKKPKPRSVSMEKTDMAVVVSQSQNEVDDFRKKGLDIATHRARMLKEDLDEKFKDPKDPFRIVFVCAMWMTGFDVPCCSTIYLDKPMRKYTHANHRAGEPGFSTEEQRGDCGLLRRVSQFAEGAGDLRLRFGRRRQGRGNAGHREDEADPATERGGRGSH